MTEESNEFLNWLCWVWAQDGERFYPPDETAEACVANVRENYAEKYSNIRLDMELERAYQWEVGQHSRAYEEAVMKFKHAHNRDIDPVERAAREHRELMEDNESLEPIDWTWLTERRSKW